MQQATFSSEKGPATAPSLQVHGKYMYRNALHLGLWRVGGVAGGRLAGRAGDFGPLQSFSLPDLGLAAAPKKLASVFCPAAGAASPLLLRLGAMVLGA
jgi:hypothetical protein